MPEGVCTCTGVEVCVEGEGVPGVEPVVESSEVFVLEVKGLY